MRATSTPSGCVGGPHISYVDVGHIHISHVDANHIDAQRHLRAHSVNATLTIPMASSVRFPIPFPLFVAQICNKYLIKYLYYKNLVPSMVD